MSAGSACPCRCMPRDRYTKPCGGVGYLPIQLFEVDVQAVALSTSRLLILSNTFHIQQLRRGFIQNGGGCFDIFPIDQKFNSAPQVRLNQSIRTMLSSVRKHSIPDESRLPCASSASGKFWKRRIMTRSRSSMTSTPVAASFRVMSSPLPLTSAFRVSRAAW